MAVSDPFLTYQEQVNRALPAPRAEGGAVDGMGDKLFVIHSDTKITLSPLAKEMARMHGMTLAELGQHLIQQHKLQQAGLVQKDGEN
jgi:hypothetical protein